MFRFFPRLAAQRPVLTTMLVAVFAVLGVFGFASLRVELFPEVDFPVVTVTTVYPGAGPAEVETQVTEPIEEALASLANVDEMTSFSQDNLSVVIVVFDLEVSSEQAAIDVRDQIEGARALLPAAAEPPTVQRFDFGAMPIMSLALAGPEGVDALYELADEQIRDRLSRVDGVAQVNITGGRAREVEVLVHPEQLTAHGVTLSDIVNLLRSENVSVPGGRLRARGEAVPVRVVGEYASLEEIAEMRIPVAEGQSVRLDDLATIRDGFEPLDQVARQSGQPAVSLSIQQISGANTVDTAAGVRAELARIRAELLPPGTTLDIVRDESEFVEASVQDVLGNMLIGIALTAAVLFLFLHSWRSTIIAALAMPTTIISTFFLMDLLGFSLNVMTLMALGITVGILVTNTIVVLENISRHIDAGEPPKRAAEEGAAEIGIAVAASTLTNIVVFAPIAFMEGIMGQFFYAFGLTVVFATVFSIFISFTLAPLLAARLLRRTETSGGGNVVLAPLWRRWDAAYRGLETRYRGSLIWTLRRPRNGWIVLLGILAIAITLLTISGRFITADFIPSGDEGAAQITLELPTDASIERTEAVAAEVERRLLALDQVESTLVTISGAADMFAGGGGVNQADILVMLRDDADTQATIRTMRRLLADLPDTSITVTATDPAGQGPGGAAPIQLDFIGPDYGDLEVIAAQAEAALARRPELGDVINNAAEPRTELVFRPDRTALADYGVSVAELGGVIQASVEGALAGVYRGELGRELDIRVSLVERARQRPEQLGQIEVRTPRAIVPMSTLGTWVEEEAPAAIQRIDRERAIRLDIDLGAADLLSAVAAIEATMATLDAPPGVTWSIGGEFEMFEDAFGAMLSALLLAVLLTYIVLAMILESFIHPLTIMLTLPLGAVGALLGLFLANQSMNLFSMMAIVMLVGIVVNNAILILDYTAQLRQRGRSIADALVEAAPTRLRPIVMSNVAIAVALLPQALATGDGAAFRVPMAVVTIGGVLLAAVFTLFLIPVIYTKLDRFALHKPESR
jgi:hydrophobic/amphiphilic exporter-1 (mainly G- bacteria), HAE1 family